MSFAQTVQALDLEKYFVDSGLEEVIKRFDGEKRMRSFEKLVPGAYDRVDPKMKVSFGPELDDLVRLHFAVTSRRVFTVLEFGVGYSTLIFSHALRLNQVKFKEAIDHNQLRVSNPFECHSVDNYKSWIRSVRRNILKHSPDPDNTRLHYSNLEMGTFNGRVCTYYTKLPNICPSLIYLDGPDQFSPKGDIRGVSTRHPDRMPMSADILAIEHFLQPGTLIIVDGRTSNARFLKCNLQRDWDYSHNPEYDQHYFELMEEPLGPYNERLMRFSRG